MTRVVFYFNAADKAEAARRLAAKAYRAGQCALLYTPDEALAADLDAALWTSQQLSFLPHVRCGHPLARQTPVLIGDNPEELRSADVLVNLAEEQPAFFGRFERLMEIVGLDPIDRQAARERYRYYQARGYGVETHDLTK
ncbi:MAG: DNA polymerase III subunit chi [Thiobacillaceae bacterium]|jgi:DNA polymerase-3 subunit chi|nr:DNA polymerase III subunit chi [Thiobacillaceae bacterium]